MCSAICKLLSAYVYLTRSLQQINIYKWCVLLGLQTDFQHPARAFSWFGLTLKIFFSFEWHASTTPVKIASWLLPMHRKCCHNVVDCTQCIESRYDYHYFCVNMFWNLSILIMMTVFCSQRKGVFVHFVWIFFQSRETNICPLFVWFVFSFT